MNRGPLRVVLADDHPVVRDGLSALLSSVPGIEVVAAVGSGREAVRAAVTEAPDVVVLDVQMPDTDGVTAATEVLRAAPSVAVLMLTMFDDDDTVFAAMRAGAHGYLLKGATQQEIVRGIHAVAAGEAIFGPGVARRVLGLVGGPERSAEPFPELTRRERQVLELLAAGRTTTAVGAELGLAPKTVTNHASAVFAKLGVGGRAEAVARARRAGLGGPGGGRTGGHPGGQA
ncbi:MAG: two-component system response regulator [Actinomycetospora sp.]|nr:two-component system response regulator [Actinomycetospora sp.]